MAEGGSQAGQGMEQAVGHRLAAWGREQLGIAVHSFGADSGVAASPTHLG